ncbi:phosphoribosylformylglycinamidine synthase [Desulfonema ishimotonii]|uniref:Phosphoribosylformylglycinamidine synthase n=1 Tax=Desulfonema ishimotonii TaxID=45657 RepID=A0A401FQS0_9BACT|nr:phosphoribosylformylglycinamidine synthase I [Desulfonema ishimotonii]GBC59304.1 phosphoribosylformylglycinamidine synthase [Desulfonema ishimotonii]
MSSDVRVLVLTGYGLNCDCETAHAFELAGAESHRVHINSLIDGSVHPDDFQIMVFGGGFSWGDDHGAGVIQAVRMRTNIGDQLLSFVNRGNLVLGICNGFQTLVNLGLLPGIDGDYTTRSVALTHNDCGNFRDDWVSLKTNADSPCVFTKGIDRISLPIRHGEGKFYTDAATLARLVEKNQVVFRYALPDGAVADGKFPFNPNGSMEDVAGICDTTGRIFGLMPHPEADHHVTNQPDWTRKKEREKRGDRDENSDPKGIKLFENAVNHIRSNPA